MYKGPYSGMEAMYKEIFQWIAQNGHQPEGIYYEYYLNSPREAPESELLTEIVIPIR
jgi:effector-binding domain-containing protein